MRFTDLFVRRPVLALVVSTLILLLGLRALSGLPVRQYPLTESTTITVTTEYPGASPDLMQGFVTQPIAQSVATVEGIDYLSSSSTQGRSVITVRMKLNADSNKAMTEVMAKVNEVKYRLPRDAYDPVLVKSSGEATAVAYVGFSSSTLSLAALTDYLSRVVQPQFSSIDGVASVQLYGGQKLAMRVWLDPNRMAARGISAGQLADALRANNVQAAPGRPRVCTWCPTSRSTPTWSTWPNSATWWSSARATPSCAWATWPRWSWGRPRPIPAACWTASAPCTSA